MALLGRFKKEDDPHEREPSLRDKDQILAYLEELFRTRIPLSMRLEEDSPISYETKVERVSEEHGHFTLRLQNRLPQEPKPGTLFHFCFAMDGRRFKTQARFQGRGGYLQSEFVLPEAICHAERRSQVRVRLGHREAAKAVVLEGLFDGLGISGAIVNLSLDGLSLRVDRVIDIRKDRRLSPRSDLFVPGTPLALIRLQDLPLTPNLECSGILRQVHVRGESLFLGLQLESLGAFESQALARLIAHKVPGFTVHFPWKRRRGEIESEEEALLEEPPEDADIQPPTESEKALDDREIQDLRVIIGSPDRISLLRRRSRHILLVASDELERAILLGTLYVDGYRNIHEANGLVQALDQARRHVLDAVIVEQQTNPHSALELIQHLRNAGRLAHAKVIVLKSREDIKLTVAEKAGGIDLVVAHPVNFDGLLKPGLERLLGL